MSYSAHQLEGADHVGVARRGWLVASALAMIGFLLIAGLVGSSGGRDTIDVAIWRHTVGLRNSGLTVSAHLITVLGSVPVVLGAGVAAAAGLWWRTRNLMAPFIMLAAVGGTGALVYLLKIAVSRARPPVDKVLGLPSLDYSFPSGHATDGSVVYVLAATLFSATVGAAAVRRLLVALSVVVAVAIGLTRVYLGYHWASDVLAGWLLASTVLTGAVYVFRVGLELSTRRYGFDGLGLQGQRQLEATPAVRGIDDGDVTRLRP